MGKNTQFLLPIGTFKNPNPKKGNEYTTTKGQIKIKQKLTTRVSKEEATAHKEYEDTGVDHTDGVNYWSTFRR